MLPNTSHFLSFLHPICTALRRKCHLFLLLNERTNIRTHDLQFYSSPIMSSIIFLLFPSFTLHWLAWGSAPHLSSILSISFFLRVLCPIQHVLIIFAILYHSFQVYLFPSPHNFMSIYKPSLQSRTIQIFLDMWSPPKYVWLTRGTPLEEKKLLLPFPPVNNCHLLHG